MNNHFVSLTLALAFSAGLASSHLGGQTSLKQKFTVPFDFEANGAHIVAGQYQVVRSSGSPILKITSLNTLRSIMLLAGLQTGPNKSDSKLVFHRYGSKYFLSQVWFEGEPGGRNCGESKAEKEYRAANAGAEPKLVYLAMR